MEWEGLQQGNHRFLRVRLGLREVRPQMELELHVGGRSVIRLIISHLREKFLHGILFGIATGKMNRLTTR
jgi:hypothetical protein